MGGILKEPRKQINSAEDLVLAPRVEYFIYSGKRQFRCNGYRVETLVGNGNPDDIVVFGHGDQRGSLWRVGMLF